MRLSLERPYDHYWILFARAPRGSDFTAFEDAVIEEQHLVDGKLFNQVRGDDVIGWEYLYQRDEDKVLAHAIKVAERLGLELNIA